METTPKECKIETDNFLTITDKIDNEKEKEKEKEKEDTDSMSYDDTSNSVESFKSELEENQLLSLREKVDASRLLSLQRIIKSSKKTLESLYRELQSREGKKICLNEDNLPSNNLRDNIDSITTKLKRYIEEYLKDNSIVVNYIHSKKLTDTAIGRKYAKNGLSLQTIPSVFRDFLLGNSNDNDAPLNTDVDIKSAHPSIALDIAKQLNLSVPALEDYVNNRQEFLDKLYKEEGVDKETVKIHIISMLNSQDFKKKKPYTKEIADLDKEFKLLQNEVYKSENYAELKGLEDTSKGNPKGSFLNIIMTCVENRVLTNLYNALLEKGYKINTLIFDGLLVVGNHYGDEGFIELCNNAVDILQHTKLQISLKPIGTTLKDLMDEETEEVDVDKLPEHEPNPVKKQLETDKNKTDDEWVMEIDKNLNRGDYMTDNSTTNFYANPIGGYYVPTNKEGLHAELMRNIQENFKKDKQNRRLYLERYSNLSRLAHSYMIKYGKIDLDQSKFDLKNIGVPFKNGVFRNQEGNITKALPAEMVMKTCGYNLKLYDYSHPDLQTLEGFLMDCFKPEDRDYTKHHTGKFLLGCDKKFFILYGQSGNNGKTKAYCKTLLCAFQDLATNMKQEHITTGYKKSVEGCAPETLLLKSNFINIISELTDDTQIDAGLLKSLSGESLLNARGFNNGVMQTFPMKGIILIDTNKTGNINNFDNATNNRLVVFHFPYEFINSETYNIPAGRDKDDFKPMKDISSFFTNTEDINSKCFSLLYYYYKNYSLNEAYNTMSDSLKAVREKIAMSVCSISRFIEECCEVGNSKTHRVSADDLWASFDYQQRGNVKKISKSTFYGRMESLNYKKKKIRMYKKGDTAKSLPYGYEGIKVRAENTNSQFVRYTVEKTTDYYHNSGDDDSECEVG